MYWIAGYVGPGDGRVPVDGLPLDDVDLPGVRVAGRPPRRWVRSVTTPLRHLLIVGACAASTSEIGWLARSGVPDDVAWRWAGAYIVIERTRAATTIWTDLANAVPVYSVDLDLGAYWATSARALAGLTNARTDEQRIGAELLAPATPLVTGSRTFFDGVRLLPAGHRVRITTAGPTTTTRVWRPAPATTGLEPVIRDVLDTAVGVRVDHALAPSTDLSGGLDSTSLTVLAARRLSPRRSIAAFTVHAPFDEPTGDLRYALDAAQHPGVRHHLVPLAPEHLPYSDLGSLPPTDEPAPSTIAYARFTHQLDAMVAAIGTDAHLTGDGGDSLLMTPDAWIADLIATGRFAEAARESVRIGRVRRCAPVAVLRRASALNQTDPARALVDWARLARGEPTTPSRARQAMRTVSALRQAPWVSGAARWQAAALAEQTARQVKLPGSRGDLAVWDVVEQMTEVGRSARADAQLADARGVTLHNPFADSRVIDRYLSSVVGRMPSPAAFKPTLRASMRNVLPPSLLTRTTKGVYAPDFHHGLRVNRAGLVGLVDGHLAEAGLVEPAALVTAINLAAGGIAGSIWLLDAAITIEAWLRAHHAAPLPTWRRATAEVGKP